MEDILLHQKRIHGLPETISLAEKAMLAVGVPVQKIIGFINFENLVIKVNRHVLIPRYETQEVVHEALRHIDASSKVLDLCCGSGYIGLTIKQKTGCDVTLSDIADEAIAQTAENAHFNNLDVKIIKSDLFAAIVGKFDLIIANPPYIPQKTFLPQSVLDHEPHNALFGGLTGNDFLRSIIKDAPRFLNKNGYLVLEISPANAPYVISQGFSVLLDINNKARIGVRQFKA